MLHQIRKMVSMMVLMLRYDLHWTVFERSFLPDKMNIPKAPGLGLLLEQVAFFYSSEQMTICSLYLADTIAIMGLKEKILLTLLHMKSKYKNSNKK